MKKHTSYRRKKTNTILIVAGLIILVIGVWYFTVGSSAPGPYDDFARCLGEKGLTFFGAFWCPHCQNQKEMFGSSAKYLPYVECSTPDGGAQNASCQQRGIKSYPTWEFPGGERITGEVELSTLSQKSGCALPAAQ